MWKIVFISLVATTIINATKIHDQTTITINSIKEISNNGNTYSQSKTVSIVMMTLIFSLCFGIIGVKYSSKAKNSWKMLSFYYLIMAICILPNLYSTKIAMLF